MPDRISRYDLLNRLGTGGMGTVWRARDVRNGSEVAIKVLHQHLAADADYVRRFQREARVAASIDSPNVVKVLDSGRDGDSYFLVMEYVLGHTLSQEIQARHRFTIEDSVAIAVSVAQGLLAAQAVGVVHRDISPQNVIIANDGTVKITDFGIARDLGATAMTATSMILGKPQYLAPEVATGHGQADIRSDIYALGVTLFQMLTGQVPFDAVTPFDVLKMQVDQAPPDLQALRPEVPPWLAGVVQKCLGQITRGTIPDPSRVAVGTRRRQSCASRPRRNAFEAKTHDIGWWSIYRCGARRGDYCACFGHEIESHSARPGTIIHALAHSFGGVSDSDSLRA